jgi:hypothetical protein
MQECLSDILRFDVVDFHFLAGNKLSLRQLEDILLSVDDTHSVGAEGKRTHITSLQPPISSDSFLSQLLCLIVPQDDATATQPYLPSRRRVT